MVPRLVLIVAWWALLVSIVNSGGFDHFFGIGLSLSCWMLTVDRRTKTGRAPCRVVQGQDIRPILLKPSRLGKSLVMGKRTRTTFHRPIPRPSITATTNDHQPETNDHQPPTTNHQPTTNNQAPTTKNQQPTTNNQQPTKSEAAAYRRHFALCTTHHDTTTNNRAQPAHNQQPHTNNQPPAKGEAAAYRRHFALCTTNHRSPYRGSRISSTRATTSSRCRRAMPFGRRCAACWAWRRIVCSSPRASGRMSDCSTFTAVAFRIPRAAAGTSRASSVIR